MKTLLLILLLAASAFAANFNNVIIIDSTPSQFDVIFDSFDDCEGFNVSDIDICYGDN